MRARERRSSMRGLWQTGECVSGRAILEQDGSISPRLIPRGGTGGTSGCQLIGETRHHAAAKYGCHSNAAVHTQFSFRRRRGTSSERNGEVGGLMTASVGGGTILPCQMLAPRRGRDAVSVPRGLLFPLMLSWRPRLKAQQLSGRKAHKVTVFSPLFVCFE